MHNQRMHARNTLRLTARLSAAMVLPAVLMLWLALFSASSAAQAVPPAGTASPASSATAGPIAVPDILARANEDQQRVDRAKQLLQAPDPVQGLGQTLDAIARSTDSKLDGTGGDLLHTLPVMRLESLSRHWEFEAKRFARWEDQARRTLAPYESAALELAQRRTAWSATRAAGLLDGLPPALSSRVDAMLAEIDVSEAALGAVLARQFELTRRASELSARMQGGRAGVALAIDELDRRLFQLDAPALWHGLGTSGGTRAALHTLERGLQIESQFAVDYHAANNGNRQALRMLQLLLLPLIVWLVIRSRRAPDTVPDARGAHALRRPISAWLLLSMLAVLVLEPDAPLLVQEIALLLAVIPVMRLLPPGTLSALRGWPKIAIALYCLDRLGVAVVADASLYRLFLLALNGLALGLTIWLLRQPQLSRNAMHSAGGRLHRATRPLGWTAAFTLVLAGACNVMGNVSLAEMLTSGVIDSGYMALFLYAGVSASMGLLQALAGQPELTNRRLVRQHLPALQTVFSRLLVFAAVAGWLLYSLDRLRMLRPLQRIGSQILDVGIDVGEVSLHVGDVLAFVVSIWVAYWSARALRRVLRDELPGHAGLPRGVGNSIASLSYYGVLLLGCLVALSAAGFKVGQLALVFGALGVGIGFGLQNVVNNFVSGLVLMFERPIQPGDMVEFGAIAGTVREIGLRATTIRSYDGADVVVPNGLLLSGNLTNWTLYDRSRRFEIAVSAAYGSDPAQVLSLLEATARDTPGVALQPAPFAQMTGYGDSALNFVLRAWTQDVGNWGTLRSDLLRRILSAMQAAGISIPYNQLDVHLSATPSSDPAKAAPDIASPGQAPGTL